MFTNAVSGRARNAGFILGTICLTAFTTVAGCGGGGKKSSTYEPPHEERSAQLSPGEAAGTSRAETSPGTYGDMIVEASGVTAGPAAVSAGGRDFIGLQGGRYEYLMRQLRINTQPKEYILFSKGGDLFTISPSGSGLTNKTNTPSLDEIWGDWAGYEGQISFIKKSTTPVGVELGLDVFTMRLDGSGIVNLTNTTVDEFDASATPNGVITFVRNVNAFDLFTMRRNGTNLTQITATAGVSEFGPNGSSNGAKLAFHRLTGVTGPGTGAMDVFVANADGTNPVNITNTPNVAEESPALSPDGTRVLFQKMNDIFVANADGSNVVNVTNTPNEREVNADWSPTGTHIVYARRTGTGPWDLFVMNADGSGVANITNTPNESETGPRWSPSISPFQVLIGREGALGGIASGTVFAQQGGNTTAVAAFDINNDSTAARANVRVTPKVSGSQVIYTLGFAKPTSDSFISLKYLNGDGKPVTVIGTGSSVSKASGATIVFDTLSGKIVNITPTGP